MAILDPWGPILAVIFDDSHTSDYVINILGLAGFPTIFHFSTEQSYSNSTRKRAIRNQMGETLSQCNSSDRFLMAESIARILVSQGDPMSQNLAQLLAEINWMLKDGKLVPLEQNKHVIEPPREMGNLNLTEDQIELLRKVVTVYSGGCRSEFIVSRTMQGSSLIYHKHPAVAIDADDSDFERLAEEQLIQLGRTANGDFRGKPTAFGIALIGKSNPETKEKEMTTTEPDAKPRIFIGHGQSRVWKDLKDLIFERLELDWDEFDREPSAGLSTKERLESMLNNAAFAFLVMTAEDERSDGSRHARENVVHEAGLFQGKLGFKRAIILLEEGCMEFSNIEGLTQIRFPPGNILAKSEEIRRVLEREGILPATNK